MDHPKLPPDAIVRQPLNDWLARHADRRVRIVAGQPGSGKTVALAAWSRGRGGVRWFSVANGATESDLRAQLPSFADGELVVDGADQASEDGRAFLAQLARTVPGSARFVYLVRSALMFAGVALDEPAVATNATMLQCSDREIERFCAAHDVAATAKDRQRLLMATGGWTFAIAGTIRYAAAIGGSLGAAFPRWLATARPFIAQLVDDAAGDAPLAAAAFDRIARGVGRGADDLRDACDASFFVERTGDSYSVNPVVASLRGDGRGSARPAPAVVHMFGRFRVTIGNDEVCFGRRRARSVIQYLAVRDDGTATRAELLREFWPGMDSRAAADALVNTCSTIRRAIAECVGRDAVDEYFVVHRSTVALRFGNVVSTANRFSTHVKVASAASGRGDLDATAAHCSAALRLHSAPLLSGEPPAPWIAAAQRAFDDAARTALHLLAAVPPAVTAHAGRELTA